MTLPAAPQAINSYRKYWAQRFGTATFLPTSRAEMDELGWDSCDIIIISGDCYIDHPSFGMALVGRLLEAQGFRVGIIAQPDWNSAEAFRQLGKPNLFFGVTAGNMDSMINRYTADRRPRSDDAYTPHGEPNKRPDRAVTVYAQRCREAYPGIGVMIGSIEASLRRIAHFDYWSDKVRQSVLVTSKADILLYGNAERALVEIAHRASRGEKLSEMRDIRGTAFMVPHGWRPDEEWQEMDSSVVDIPGRVDPHLNPYQEIPEQAAEATAANDPTKPQVIRIESREERLAKRRAERAKTVIRIPSYEAVAHDPVLYAHASRTLHLESNPGNARALVQLHGARDVWLTPPPIPLTTEEMDFVFGLSYARNPHPSYGNANIPAWEMIKYSVNIMRGCFGGCTFCSITEHEGRIIQSRSEESILKEIEEIRDKTPGFTGHISDLGGPTANMYRLSCKDPKIEQSCRKLSCVFPDICENLGTDHGPLIQLYRKARALPGVKKINIQSGLRYDLAVRSPEYIKELVQHHVGGYLKIAPEHTEDGPLSKMMKPGMGAYDKFKELFERFSRQAGKEQYLIPYFIAAHPGTSDEDMVNLALWLKKNNYRLDQVQTFTPTPMAMATTMWHTRRNPLKKLSRSSEKVDVVRDGYRRKLHKALLRYHHSDNWQIIYDALIEMGRTDLIGHARQCLIPPTPPGDKAAAARNRFAGQQTLAARSKAQGQQGSRGQATAPRGTGKAVAAKPAPQAKTAAGKANTGRGGGGSKPSAKSGRR